MHKIVPPIPAFLDSRNDERDACLVWAIIPDPVNVTKALISLPGKDGWEVQVNADRLTF